MVSSPLITRKSLRRATGSCFMALDTVSEGRSFAGLLAGDARHRRDNLTGIQQLIQALQCNLVIVGMNRRDDGHLFARCKAPAETSPRVVLSYAIHLLQNGNIHFCFVLNIYSFNINLEPAPRVV